MAERLVAPMVSFVLEHKRVGGESESEQASCQDKRKEYYLRSFASSPVGSWQASLLQA